MVEEFHYDGTWWLADNPQEKISGTLKYTSEKGGVLDLIGAFNSIHEEEMLHPEIILGICSDGEVTLNQCHATKIQTFKRFRSGQISSSLTVSSFFIENIFIGVHFMRKENIKFKELSIHYSNLDEWVNISGFNIKHKWGEAEVNIEYKTPESIQAVINSDLKILVDIQATAPPLSHVQKKACIGQKTYITIKPSKEKFLDDYLKIMYNVRNFLSFGIMKPVYPIVIEGKTEANKEMIGDIANYPIVKIFYYSHIPRTFEKIQPDDMFLPSE